MSILSLLSTVEDTAIGCACSHHQVLVGSLVVVIFGQVSFGSHVPDGHVLLPHHGPEARSVREAAVTAPTALRSTKTRVTIGHVYFLLAQSVQGHYRVEEHSTIGV